MLIEKLLVYKIRQLTPPHPPKSGMGEGIDGERLIG